jgi:ubiquinone/menaquinone biosynthesis C-methylase UbiE
MEMAVGGQFEAFGILMRELLIQTGLERDGYVIDVGCGSGRLAKPLSQYLSGRYLGIDVEPERVAYARKSVKRPNCHFEIAAGVTIPERDHQADMV